MPNPFASIWEDDLPVPAPKVTITRPKGKTKEQLRAQHADAIKIYDDYLIKVAELKRHQDYAERVCKATAGSGMTPVKPLATMGTNGGALLCDHCHKPMLLEGGAYHNIPVDVAWKLNPHRENKWISWISGGMVIRIVDNGTLRVYHGYEGNPSQCCTIARMQMDKAEEAHVKDMGALKKLFAFVADEFDHVDQNEMVSRIFSVMFSFDPGIGVNVP